METSLPTVDAAIHLAGLYRFGSTFTENYRANVIGTQTLLDALRPFAPSRVLFASTYAVGIGSAQLKNAALPSLPAKKHAYAYTKTLAERLLEAASLQQGHSTEIFRLGILTGDSLEGRIEKLDGPYGIYKNLLKVANFAPKTFPMWIPANPKALLPLVAVDEAARVIVGAALAQPEPGIQYRSVFRPDSVSVAEFTDAVKEQIWNSTRKRMIPLFKPIEGISENLDYAQWICQFDQDSTQHQLSHWSALKKSFFEGADRRASK